MILGFFRLLLLLAAACVLYLFWRIFFSSRRPPARTPGRPQISGVMVKDETCNTYLSREEAIVENVAGKDFFFCSQECRRKFLEKNKA